MSITSPTAAPPRDFPSYSPEDLGLFDPEPHECFEGLTRLASRLFDTPVALVSIIDREADRQFFTSHQGLSEPWRSLRETPLSHSFCQHVQSGNAPLIVADAREHDLVKDNLAVPNLGVIAYLGVPIHAPDGAAIGALCVNCPHPRAWTEEEVSLLTDLAACASEQILLRATLLTSQALNRDLAAARDRGRRFSALRSTIMEAFTTPEQDVEVRFTSLLAAGCEALGLDAGAIVRVDGDTARTIARFPLDPATDGALPEGRDLQHASLTAHAVSGHEIIHCSDCPKHADEPQRAFDGSVPGSCIVAPLMLDGVVYGALEFICREPRDEPWGDAEISAVGIIAMLVTSLLGVFGQIEKLRKSESALLDYILDLRAGRAGCKTLA